MDGWRPGSSAFQPSACRSSRCSEGVQWADWDADGRLLVATVDGRLQAHAGSEGEVAVRAEVDLAALAPAPAPPPEEAQRW